jgi:hypothetical protein
MLQLVNSLASSHKVLSKRDYQTIYFNDILHKYCFANGNTGKSVTTLLGQYKEPFDTRKIAKACTLKSSSRYYGWSVEQVLLEWDSITKTALDKGNTKHSFMEDSINHCNGYTVYKPTDVNKDGYIQLYTVDSILNKPKYGILNLDQYAARVGGKYPKVFEIVKKIVDKGYKIYAEVCTYNPNFEIFGLVDTLLIKYPDFVILDWKTNVDPLSYEAGYYTKDKEGKRTNLWVRNNVRLRPPLSHLEQSHGNEYSLQLSMYAYLCELFGLNCKMLILAHIRTLEDGNDVIEDHLMEYKKSDIITLLDYEQRRKRLLANKANGRRG